MTTSLFGTTLLVSFLVVGMPHILPCPAPRTQLADYEITEDGKQRRRRRPSPKQRGSAEYDTASQEEAVTPEQATATEEQEALRRKAHECPVPKPGGRIGEILGFSGEDEKTKRKPELQIEPRANTR
ncbi:MAG: hypothetical protein L6R40_008215 [Gallowayella cf. fulva]|nr:MAG: hypothetical protein L6R40_008215 [Xanthomendoza cf. fulva]